MASNLSRPQCVKGSIFNGQWVKYLTSTFDLTLDLELGFFNIKFWNSCILGIGGLIYGKQKLSKSVGYHGSYVTLPFTHTHDPGLQFFKVKVWYRFRNWRVNWHETKWMWLNHLWSWLLMSACSKHNYLIFAHDGELRDVLCDYGMSLIYSLDGFIELETYVG